MKYLFITRTDWNEPPRARHQLARELSKKHTVVFVSINKFGKPTVKKFFPQKNITLLVPNWIFHGKYVHRIPIINELYQFWLYQFLKKHYKNYCVINFDPSASLIHHYFADVIYFCNDDFINLKRSKSIITKFYFEFTQRIIAKGARFCASVSYYLRDQLSAHTNFSYLILTAAEKTTLAPKYNKKKSVINVVYVGWLSKINKDWILKLSQKNNVVIKLIGPYDSENFKDLLNKNNIHFFGKKKGKELEIHLQDASVCIAPYITGHDTRHVYTMPNKFWLYLNFGHPIVTCQINRLFPLPENFIYQANSSKDFVNKVIKAHKYNSKSLFFKRLSFIKDNSWENRVNQLLDIY